MIYDAPRPGQLILIKTLVYVGPGRLRATRLMARDIFVANFRAIRLRPDDRSAVLLIWDYEKRVKLLRELFFIERNEFIHREYLDYLGPNWFRD